MVVWWFRVKECEGGIIIKRGEKGHKGGSVLSSEIVIAAGDVAPFP